MDERYSDYLELVEQLKLDHKLEVDQEHSEVHSFLKNDIVIFKLMYGTYDKDRKPSVVVTFQIDLKHHEAIYWFVEIYKLDASIIIHDSFMEDDAGETYLGEEAEIVRDLKKSQEILKDWLDTSSPQQIETFTKSKIIGQTRDHTKSFDSQFEKDEAIIDFTKTRKPGDGENMH